jgi:hypothetical protein
VPGLLPVENPSRRHLATSSMPGPLSSPMSPTPRLSRDQLTATAVLDEIAADLRRDQRRTSSVFFVEPLPTGHRRDRAPRLRDLARFGDYKALHVISSA